MTDRERIEKFLGNECVHICCPCGTQRTAILEAMVHTAIALHRKHIATAKGEELCPKTVGKAAEAPCWLSALAACIPEEEK